FSVRLRDRCFIQDDGTEYALAQATYLALLRRQQYLTCFDVVGKLRSDGVLINDRGRKYTRLACITIQRRRDEPVGIRQFAVISKPGAAAVTQQEAWRLAGPPTG